TPAGRRVATSGQDLLAGEGVVSEGARSFAVLSYADKSRLELSGTATIRDLFEGDPAARKGKRAFIEKGSVKADIAAQPKDQPMVLTTPQAESRILGTTFRLTVDPDPKKGTALEVEEGRVELRTAAGRSVDVVAGRMAIATAGAAPVVRALPKEEVLLALDFEDGKPSPLVTMGSVEKGPDHAGSRFCLSGIPDPGGVCRLFLGADAQGLFTVQGDEILSFDYWADPQAGQVNFNFYSRSRGQTFEGVVPKPVFGKWAHATIRLADLGAPDRRLHAEDWVVGLYMQAVGAAAKRFYVDNLQVIRSRVLKPRPSEGKK
ncbi:MAG TPA: FecR family protein, partial [Planctomycetota bacterium]|nr:FecR family protein [Planctomycetota bacterium]